MRTGKGKVRVKSLEANSKYRFGSIALLSAKLDFRGDSFVTVKQLASFLNITSRRIQQLCNEGVLIREKRGRYLLLASIRSYIANLKKKNKEYSDMLRKCSFSSIDELKPLSKGDFEKTFRPMTDKDFEKLKMTGEDWEKFRASCKEAEDYIMKNSIKI